jgi:hypothetical protein
VYEDSYSDDYEKGNDMAIQQVAATYLISESDFYSVLHTALGVGWEASAKIAAVELLVDAEGNGNALKVTVEA